ncbi:MAG: hypothetical protein R3C56_10935 [Pirellulaceae bacterium]
MANCNLPWLSKQMFSIDPPVDSAFSRIQFSAIIIHDFAQIALPTV